MSLTALEIEQRKEGIGGSDARDILSGNWLELWKIKKGIAEKEFTEDQRFLMDLGTAVEPVIRDRWLQSDALDCIDAGTSISPNYTVQSAVKSFMRCNIDTAIMPKYSPAFIQEIKYHTGMKDIEELADDYYGQIQHNMYCFNTDKCHFTVGFGAWGKYGNIIVPRNNEFIEHYVRLCEQFWWYVENDTAPEDVEIDKAPSPPAWTKVVNMEGNNYWTSATQDYMENEDSAKKFDESKKMIKELMADDIGVAFGNGIKAKRDKRGAVRISKLTDRDEIKYKEQAEK
jgi:hypothetical protein